MRRAWYTTVEAYQWQYDIVTKQLELAQELAEINEPYYIALAAYEPIDDENISAAALGLILRARDYGLEYAGIDGDEGMMVFMRVE